MGADDQDRFGGLAERQQTGRIFQQDHAFLGIGLCNLAMRGIVDGYGLIAVYRVIEQADLEHGPQDTLGHVVGAGLGHIAVIDGFVQGAGEIR